jgi:hypothetical protein
VKTLNIQTVACEQVRLENAEAALDECDRMKVIQDLGWISPIHIIECVETLFCHERKTLNDLGDVGLDQVARVLPTS